MSHRFKGPDLNVSRTVRAQGVKREKASQAAKEFQKIITKGKRPAQKSAAIADALAYLDEHPSLARNNLVVVELMCAYEAQTRKQKDYDANPLLQALIPRVSGRVNMPKTGEPGQTQKVREFLRWIVGTGAKDRYTLETRLTALKAMRWKRKNRDDVTYAGCGNHEGWSIQAFFDDVFPKEIAEEEKDRYRDLQQNAYDILVPAVLQNVRKPVNGWFVLDRILLETLRKPLFRSVDGFLANDALALSYHYIDAKMKTKQERVKAFTELSRLVQKSHPSEADYIRKQTAMDAKYGQAMEECKNATDRMKMTEADYGPELEYVDAFVNRLISVRGEYLEVRDEFSALPVPPLLSLYKKTEPA